MTKLIGIIVAIMVIVLVELRLPGAGQEDGP